MIQKILLRMTRLTTKINSTNWESSHILDSLFEKLGGKNVRVACKDLVEGCILLQNVTARSAHPMILAETVITSEHKEFLIAFGIPEVEVKSTLKNGMPFEYVPANKNKDTEVDYNPKLLFNNQLRMAIKSFQSFYQEWSNGKPVDVMAIKAVILPLLNFIQENNQFTLKVFQEIGIQKEIGASAVFAAILAAFMGRKLGKTEGEVIQLALAGFLRDCGMAKLPENIPHQSTHQNEANLKAYQGHAVHGYRMLKDVTVLKEGTLLSVLQHHERFDGSGFPLKLKGNQLHPFSHLLAIIDSYLEQCMEHEWETDELPIHSFTMLNKEPAGKFDKTLVNSFIYEGMTLLLGKKVQLSNGAVGEVSFVPADQPMSPYIRMQDDTVMTLDKVPSLTIERLADASL